MVYEISRFCIGIKKALCRRILYGRNAVIQTTTEVPLDPSKAYIFMLKKTGNALALSMADDRPFMLYTATAGSKGSLGMEFLGKLQHAIQSERHRDSSPCLLEK